MEKHEIYFGRQIINFWIERKDVKNINLSIKPDMSIRISASDKVPLSCIYDFVKRKGPWILKNIKQFEDVLPLDQSERQYVSGESFRYLGRQYRIRIKKSTNEAVKLSKNFIYLETPDPSNFLKKKRMMDSWYREKAYKVFYESLSEIYKIMNKYEICKPELKIRMMKTRWGSAQIDKNLIFINLKLIKAPKYCIDYVILHEFIHFKYNSHSEKFYEMLFTLMPDWEQRKMMLDKEIAREI